MKKSIIRLGLLTFMASAIACAPVQLLAQATNKIPADAKAGAPGTNAVAPAKAPKGGPFNGKLAAIDKVARTIVVGKRTFQVTSETKIKKSGKPATFDDGVVGEPVSGYVKPAADGKLIATTINFGPKVSPATTDQPKAAPEKQPKQP